MKDGAHIAVVNAGASTLKLALVQAGAEGPHILNRVQREWQGGAMKGDSASEIDGGAVDAVLGEALAALAARPDAFGFRVVHGGDRFVTPTPITDEVTSELERLVPLAPLHNAPAVAAIRAVRREFPELPAVAVFDTAFHAGRPSVSTDYALPGDVVEAFGLRRYGFHGIAHASLLNTLAATQGVAAPEVCAVTLQLGAGCSACAIRQGRSLETSMGYTPLEGLVMATRCGSVDPAIAVRLMRAGYDADGIETLLTRHSGLVALAGTADMRDIVRAAQAGDGTAERALAIFCHRIVLTVGAYLTVLDGQGAVVFGGGIGTHAPEIRARVADGLRAWNVVLDERANRRNRPGRISAPGSREVYALETDEETVIAGLVMELLR